MSPHFESFEFEILSDKRIRSWETKTYRNTSSNMSSAVRLTRRSLLLGMVKNGWVQLGVQSKASPDLRI